MILADGMAGIDLDLGVQAVVDQQHGGGLVAQVADELLGIGQAGLGAVGQGDGQLLAAVGALQGVLAGILVAAGGQRGDLVQDAAGVFHDLLAAGGVVAVALLGAVGLGNDVGAVERIVQAAPAGVGGVQREARVEHGHHQLRAGDLGDLGVDVGGGHGEVVALGQEITDLLEERLVGGGVVRLALALLVPGIDLGLDIIALGQQLAVAWRHIAHDLAQGIPEGGGVHAGARRGFIHHQIVKFFRDLQAADLNTFRHDRCLAPVWIACIPAKGAHKHSAPGGKRPVPAGKRTAPAR